MIVEEYRLRAIEAQHRSARVTDPWLRASLTELAEHWSALADRIELIEARYGSTVSAEFFQTRQRPVQQQQQVEPGKKGDG